MKSLDIKHLTSDISQSPGAMLRTIIIAVAVVLFTLFYLVGFNIPYELEPEYNEPLLTDEVIWLMWTILAVAVVTAGWSVCRIIRTRKNSSGKEFGVPVRKISWGLTAFTALLLISSYLLSGTDPININGKPYTDPYWLSIATMFIVAISVLLTVAIMSVVIGKLKISRKILRSHVSQA